LAEKKTIKKEELKKTVGYVFLAFFAAYILVPIKPLIENISPLPPILLGIVGVALTLWYFELF